MLLSRIIILAWHFQAAKDNWANMDNKTVDIKNSLVYLYVPVDVDISAYIMELDINDFDTSEDLYFQVRSKVVHS